MCMASVQGRVSVNVRLDGTIPALADTNHKNRTEQSVIGKVVEINARCQ